MVSSRLSYNKELRILEDTGAAFQQCAVRTSFTPLLQLLSSTANWLQERTRRC